MEDSFVDYNFDTPDLIPEVNIKKEKEDSLPYNSKALYNNCPICKKNCKSKYLLSSHMFGVHNKTLYKCHGCKYMFLSKSDLDTHLAEQLHETEKIHPCYKCGLGFPSELEYLNHVRRKHYSFSYKCEHCNKMFVSKESLKSHLPGHGMVFFECKICSKIFTSENQFNLHINRNHKRKGKARKKCK